MLESETRVSTLLMDIRLPHVPQFGASRSLTSSGGTIFSLCKKVATITPETVCSSGWFQEELRGSNIELEFEFPRKSLFLRDPYKK